MLCEARCCRCVANGRACFVGRNVRLRFARNIEIGRYATIGDGAILSGLGRDGLRLGARVNIGAYSRLIVGTDIGAARQPYSYRRWMRHRRVFERRRFRGVSIGKNTIIGQYFSAHPENHNFKDLSRPIREQGTTRKPIAIEEDCWLGARVTVLGGVTIGRGSVIAASSVITHDVAPFSIVAGIPGRVVGSRRGDDHDRT